MCIRDSIYPAAAVVPPIIAEIFLSVKGRRLHLTAECGKMHRRSGISIGDFVQTGTASSVQEA